MLNTKITFLTKDQVIKKAFEYGLEVFKTNGAEAILSDFSIVTGAFEANAYAYNGIGKPRLIGWYWTKTTDNIWKKHEPIIICGITKRDKIQSRRIAARPILSFNDESLSNMQETEIEYGNYPQTIANAETSGILESKFNAGTLNKTENKYTIDSRRFDEYDKELEPIELQEYEYQDQKYVRVKINSHSNGDFVLLSDGNKYKNDTYVWIKVEPIKWIKEPNQNLFISEKSLFSGIRFNKEDESYDDSKFEQTEINNYLQNYFAKEIISKKTKIYKDDNIEKDKININKK